MEISLNSEYHCIGKLKLNKLSIKMVKNLFYFPLIFQFVNTVPLIFRPVRVIRLLSEETIEEGIYSIAQEKLKLEQDLNEAGEEFDENGQQVKSAAKKDVSRLLKIALDVDIADKELGEIEKIYTEL